MEPDVPATIPPRTLNPAVLKLGAHLFANSPGAKLWAARSGKLGRADSDPGVSSRALVQASVRALLGTGGGEVDAANAANAANVGRRGGGSVGVPSDKNRVFDACGGFWRSGLTPGKQPSVAT